MNSVSLIGRLLFGGFFLYSGINHFLNLGAATGYAASKGVPMANLAVLGTGALLVIGGALVLLGWKVPIGAWLIVVFLVPTSFIMHDFWAVADPQMKMSEMVNFTKNIALAGAALMIASIRWWPLGLEKPRATEGGAR